MHAGNKFLQLLKAEPDIEHSTLGTPWQGWTAPAKPMGLTLLSRHGRRLRQGSPGILLSELILWYDFARGWPWQNPPLMDHFMG